LYLQTSECRTVCDISAGVYRQTFLICRAGESCEVCGYVSDTREPHVLCAPPCGRAVCLETLDVCERTEARTKLWLLSDGMEICLVVGFRRDVHENCALLGCYAACSGNFLPICCPETSVRSYHCTLLNSSEERRSHFSQKYKSDPNIGGLKELKL
jgi:hypothetical protein